MAFLPGPASMTLKATPPCQSKAPCPYPQSWVPSSLRLLGDLRMASMLVVGWPSWCHFGPWRTGHRVGGVGRVGVVLHWAWPHFKLTHDRKMRPSTAADFRVPPVRDHLLMTLCPHYFPGRGESLTFRKGKIPSAHMCASLLLDPLKLLTSQSRMLNSYSL